jgi:hypothetical protein
MHRLDTKPEAEAVQFRVQGGLSGEQRLVLAYEMSIFARELEEEGIRQ